MFGRKKTTHDKSVEMSLPADYTLHGVAIKKLPVGRYIKALQTVKNLPELLLKELFPGMQPAEVMDQLKTLDEKMVYEMLGKLLAVVPEQFLRVVAELTDADYDYLLNELTPNELYEVLEAFWQKNDMSDFFGRLKGLLATLNPVKSMSFGSSD